MPDNVKTALSVSIRRLLRPLVKIMLREGMSYSNFAALAQMAFVESAAKDFVGSGAKAPISSVCELTGLTSDEVLGSVVEQERFDASEIIDVSNPCARVLHGWHNDKDYVGPYGYPVDLVMEGPALSLTKLAKRHAPGVPPQMILNELRRIGAVTEVGANVWKALKQDYIEPSLSPENLGRMASLVESLLSTLENNTRKTRGGTALFERTMVVDTPLTDYQLADLHSYMTVFGARFLHRTDAYAAVELHEKMPVKANDQPSIHAGVQCFLYVEPSRDTKRLRDVIDFG